MENNNLNNGKIIIPKTIKKIGITWIKGLNFYETIWLTGLLIVCIFSIAFIDQVWIKILITIICFVVAIFSLLKNSSGKRIYKEIYLWLCFINSHKNSTINIENIPISKMIKINNKYGICFKINAESIDFLTEEDKLKILKSFFNVIKNIPNGAFVKIPKEFNFDNYQKNLLKFSQSFQSKEAEIIKNFAKSQNQNEVYLIIYHSDKKQLQVFLQQIMTFFNSKFINYELTNYQEIENYFGLNWDFSKSGFKKSNSKEKGFIWQVRDVAIENNYFWLKNLFSIKNSFCVLNFKEIPAIKAKKMLDNVLVKLNYNKTKIAKHSQSLENDLFYNSLEQQLADITDNTDAFKFVDIYTGAINELDSVLTDIKSNIYNVCQGSNFLVDKLINEQQSHLLKALTYENWESANSLNMTCYSLASSYFLARNILNDSDGHLLGEDNNGNPVILDIFTINNYRKHHNFIVFGTPGSGKTTLIKKQLEWELQNKHRIFLIDVEDEYTSWFRQNKGKILDLAGGANTINPLEIFAEEGFSYDTAIPNQLIFLDGFLKMLYPNINDHQKEFILKTIENLYVKLLKPKKQTQIHSKNIKWFTFSEVIKEAKKNSKLYDTVFFYLEPLVQRYGLFWNKPTNIALTDKDYLFCAVLQNKEQKVIDMDNKVLSIQIYLITKYIDTIIYQSRHKNQKSLIIIDEAHKLVSDNNQFILVYLSNLAKRTRKYNTALVLATQNITDMTSSSTNTKYFANIFKCMQYFFFGGMHADDISSLNKLLQDAGGLTDSQKQYLVTAEKGQFILQLDNKNFINLKVLI